MKERSLFLAGLFFIVSMLFFLPGIPDGYQYAKTIPFFVFLPAILAGMLFIRQLPGGSAVFFITVLVIYNALSLLFSRNHPDFYYAAALLSPAVFLIAPVFRQNRDKFLWFISVLSFIASSYGLLQHIGHTVRPYSFFGNPIFFGEISALTVPFVAAASLRKNNAEGFHYFTLLLAFTACLITGSRGVWLSLFVSFSFMLWLLIRNNYFKLKDIFKPSFRHAVPVIFLAVLLMMPQFRMSVISSFSKALSTAYSDSADVKVRSTMAVSALKIFLEKPLLGSGPGAFKTYFPFKQAEILRGSPSFPSVKSSYAHNVYLQLLSDTGAAGLILFLIPVVLVIIRAEKAAPSLSRDDYLFSLAASSAVVFGLLESMINFPLLILPSSVMFWLFCGMLYMTVPQNNGQRPVYGALMLAAVLACLAPFTVTVPKKMLSVFYTGYAEKVSAPFKPGHDTYFRLALSQDPDNFYALSGLAASYAMTLEVRDALLEYDKALKIYPGSADILYNCGILLEGTQRYREAEQALTASVNFNPDFSLARSLLAKVLVKQGKNSEAALQLELIKRSGKDYVPEGMAGQIISFNEATWEK